MSVEATFYEHQNWTLNKENRGSGICNVTSFVMAPADIQTNGDLLLTYKTAIGAHLNIQKSKTLEADSQGTSMNILDILYYQEITILGFRFMNMAARSGHITWSWATGKVKALARDVYGWDLRLKQLI